MLKKARNDFVSDKFYFLSFCLLVFTFLLFNGTKIAEAKELEKTIKFPSKPWSLFSLESRY